MGLPRNMPGGKSNTLSEPGVEPSVGFGELRPLELGGGPAPASCSPADRWKRESLLTTRAEVWVRTPTGPPYGHTGKMWVVPRSVDTATHLAGVSVRTGLSAQVALVPAVGGEGDVLHGAGRVAPVEGVQVVHRGEGGPQGVGRNPEQVEVVARNVRGEEEAAAGVPLQRHDGLGVRHEVRHHTLNLKYF